ncbi:MAG: hypothetical protein WD448_03845 [Woeseia sp.]
MSETNGTLNTSLSFEDLEKVYDLLAVAIDTAGPDKETLFLAKLCLILAREIGDLASVQKGIATAGADLN